MLLNFKVFSRNHVFDIAIVQYSHTNNLIDFEI